MRELVEQLRITVPYVSTVDNLADFFTKALPAKTFHPLRDEIMNVPLPLREPEYGGASRDRERGVSLASRASAHGGVLKGGGAATGDAHSIPPSRT